MNTIREHTITINSLPLFFKIKQQILLCCLVCLFPILTFSQSSVTTSQQNTSDIRFESITTANGLSHNSVNCIVQDAKGFIWMGTFDGLNRYDGTQNTIFKYQEADTTSISSNTIWSLCRAKNNDIWIGTIDGLNIYSDKTGVFKRIYLDKKNEQGKGIIDIVTTKDGSIWVATLGIGFFKIEINPQENKSEQYKITQYHHLAQDENSLLNNHVFDLYEDPHEAGVLWIGTKKGFSKFEIKKEKFTHFQHDPNNANSVADDIIANIAIDAKGMLWIATNSQGVDKFNPITEKFTHFTHTRNNKNSISGNGVNKLLIDNQNGLWITSYGSGLNKMMLDKEGHFIRFQNNPNNPYSINNNNVVPVYQDSLGIIWTGTGGGGSNYFYPKKKQFNHQQFNPNLDNTICSNNVSAIFEDSDGLTWLGSRTKGLDKIEFKNNGQIIKKIENVRANSNSNTSINKNAVISFYEDREGLIYAGVISGGVNIFDKKTNTFRRYLKRPNDLDLFQSYSVYSILEDRAGNIWFGTIDGIYQWNKKEKKVISFTNKNHPLHQLNGQGINSIFEDKEKNIWIGTSHYGLHKYNSITNKLHNYFHVPNNKNSLSKNSILCFHQDAKGIIWLGTWEGGLNRLDPKTNEFKCYRTKDGLANDVVYSIQEDEEGNLWLSTNNGISKFDLQKGIFFNFDTQDGLQGEEFNSRVGFRSKKNGLMYFGGTNGLNIFHPKEIVLDTMPPKIYITNLTKYVKGDEEDLILKENGIMEKDEITLSHNNYILFFSIAAPKFPRDINSQYQYQLTGLSDEWISMGNRQEFNLTNLDAGNYHLKVRVNTKHGKWSQEVASLKIKMLPPWWKTWWAYLLYIFTVLGIFYSFYLYRIRQLLKYQDLRIQISSDLHDDVGSILSSIAFQSEMMSITSVKGNNNDLTKLTKLSTLSRKAMGRMRDTVWAIDARRDNVESLVARMNDHLFEVFANQSMRYIFNKKIRNPKAKLAPDIRQNFYLIFKETITNALKYSNGDKVEISFIQTQRQLLLSIKDNGNVDADNMKTSGLGISNIKRRAEKINAKLTISSKDGFSVFVEKRF